MIELNTVAKILFVFMLAVISPGPDFMLVSSMSLRRGRGDGVKAAAGIACVIFLYALAGLTGLSTLFSHYLWIMGVIKLCGGLYLLYLGYAMWRGSFRMAAPSTDMPEPEIKRKNAFLTGMLTSLTNLKVIAFFASIFAIALTPDTHLATRITIGLAIPLLTFLWFSFVAFGLSKPGIRIRYQKWQHVIDRVTGSILGFFGLRLILSARS